MEKGKLNTVQVQFWLNEAQSCIERQKIELIQRNNYPFLVNYFEGVEKIDAAYPHVSTETKMAIINEYFPNTNALISQIMYQCPDILLEATRPDAEEGTPLMKSALIYAFDKGDALIENRVALFDMLYAGYCAVEVDQINISKKANEIDNIPNEEEKEEPQGIFDKVGQMFRKSTNPTDVEKNYTSMMPVAESSFSTAQGTYFRRYDPLDIPLDWRASRIKDRRYNLKKVWLSKAEFDSKYPAFKDSVNAEDDRFEYSTHGEIIHNRKILLYEFQVRFRDNRYQTIIISPQMRMREIDAWDRPYTTNNFNVKIGTLHKYGKLYPRSFAQVNKRMQDEMNEYVKHLMEVSRRNIPKRLYDRNKIKADGLELLKNTKVNENVPCEGNTSGVITPIEPTKVSYENKELLAIFQDQKNKLWSVSESRISGRSQSEFATDMVIQEEGFKERNVDIQEGLRILVNEEMDTAKDLIVSFWDNEVFLKVTGSEKVKWYEPIVADNPNKPGEKMVLNPLTDLLTGDYMVKIDIASASRQNRSQQLQAMVFFMSKLAEIRQILIDQGKDINIDEIRRISKEFGWNPDRLFIDYQPAMQPTVPTATGETITPEEDARRQAEAEARLSGDGNVV